MDDTIIMHAVEITTKVNVKVGTRVFVNHIEGFGASGTVVELRDTERCKIKVLLDGQTDACWVFDSEITRVI